MRTLLFKTLVIILSTVVVSSCIKPHCFPLETFELSAEGQEYVLDSEEDIIMVFLIMVRAARRYLIQWKGLNMDRLVL